MEKEKDERRVGERRGRAFSRNQKLNEFIHNFWNRYFHDRSDEDRRKQTDRRESKTDRKPTSVWQKFSSLFRRTT